MRQVKNFVEYIGSIAPEKKIIPGLAVGVRVFHCAGTLRRVADLLSGIGEYF